jgi:hypothetical protein
MWRGIKPVSFPNPHPFSTTVHKPYGTGTSSTTTKLYGDGGRESEVGTLINRDLVRYPGGGGGGKDLN